MHDALAVVLTLVTRGNDLTEGDLDWIDRQMILPAIPPEGDPARQLDQVPEGPLVFVPDQLHRIGALVGAALIRQLSLEILALTVQPWYLHLVYEPASIAVEKVISVAEGALQRLFGAELSIWADYAKRFCFEPDEVASWVEYVERHNIAAGWEAQPWPFISRMPEVDG